jgi:hypothetical protein
MGGFGSGKGFRYNRASTRRRLYTTQLRFLDRKEIDVSNIDINDPWVIHKCFGGIAYLKMKPHILRQAAVWYSFECFYCKEGACRLYFRDEKLACRRCHDLAYKSENKGKADRAIDRKWVLVDRLGRDGFGDNPRRPKGMHRRTYDRMIDRIRQYDRLAYLRFFSCESNIDSYMALSKRIEKSF